MEACHPGRSASPSGAKKAFLSCCLAMPLCLTIHSTRTPSAPVNLGVSLVKKSVLFKPLNIQTAFTFSGALFVGKSSFFCFSGAKLFHGLRSSSGRGILLPHRQGLTWRSRRTRKSSAPLNFSVSLVGKSVLFKPLNIQTAFTFFSRFVCWKIFFLLFQWRKVFSRLARAVRPWHSSCLVAEV